MVLGASVRSPLGYSITMLIGLSLDNSFDTREGSLVGVSLGTMDVLVIGTVEGSLVGLSLKLPLGSPIESLNPVDVLGYLFGSLTFITLGMSLVNNIGYLFEYIFIIN